MKMLSDHPLLIGQLLARAQQRREKRRAVIRRLAPLVPWLLSALIWGLLWSGCAAVLRRLEGPQKPQREVSR